MSDRVAASAGFVVAGIALAAGFMSWPGSRGIAVSALAVLAVAGFGLRRYDRLDRASIPVAGAIGLGVAAIGVATLLGIGVEGLPTGPGPALATVAGASTVMAAYADWQAVGADRMLDMAGATVVAAFVGVSGLVAIAVWFNLIAVAVTAIGRGEPDQLTMTVLSPVALGVGTATVVALYLRGSDRGLAFIDLRWPDRRDLAYAFGGAVLLLGLNVAIGLLYQRFGVESASHSVVRTAESTPEILLALVPLSYLLIGPGEELLYRNVVQKSLYDAFSRRAAIVVASLIFAGVHFFVYRTPGGSLLATFNTLSVVFVLSIVLGVVYERTRNVAVSALVHGTFNAVIFAVQYAYFAGVELPV